MPDRSVRRIGLLAAALSLCLPAGAQKPTDNLGWPTYGGDPGGERYSAAAQITRDNVNGLQPVWEYHTHALESRMLAVSRSDFEATPILFGDTLYLSTPFDRIIALDPATGAERWTYDPGLAKDLMAANYTSRGVAAWADSKAKHGALCGSRIFLATLDARLISVDAQNGRLCAEFGVAGQIDLRAGLPTRSDKPYLFFGNTSPPTVVGDVVVVGSAVGDNQAVETEPGTVRGFDARTGRLLWSWDPLPWAEQQHPRTSAANAWGVLAADPEHHLVFVPTTAPSPDFYGGYRPGDDRDANSIVALNTDTGKKVWAYQLIHHDVWDYDVASEPLLFEFHGIPAVAVAPKTGVVFVFNRLTGEPLYPITERPVPQDGVPGERLSPTQPFSSLALNPLHIDTSQLPGHDPVGEADCRARMNGLRYDGIFTPPTLQGSVQFPGSLGGVNWSSMSLDPATGILYANTDGSAYDIQLRRRPSRLRKPGFWYVASGLFLLIAILLRRRPAVSAIPALVAICCVVVALHFKSSQYSFRPYHDMVNSPDSVGELSANLGAPYMIYRRVLEDRYGRPCTPTPWGATAALDLNTGKLLWRKPLGTLIAGQHTGTVNYGAPIATAGGLLFTAASSEPLLRAIDKNTGEELWTGKIPVSAQSTPMTYMYRGRQYVVVAAGGHGGLGTQLGDSVIAFALPRH